MTLGTEQRDKVYLDRYSLKDESGKPTEKISDTWQRVAKGIAADSRDEAEFYDLLKDFKFVPGGRILAGAGTNTEVTFFNCFVIPVENRTTPENGNDSREAIFDTISRMVDIMSRGGGVGINWSTLRPNGAYLSRINGTTTGPIEWMDVASKAVGAVMQGGSRRGAAMFMLHDWHPDVLSFIDAKRDLKKITNANISVCVSDRFMEALKNDGDWELLFPDTTHPDYNKIWNGDLDDWGDRPTKVYQTVKAREIWRKLAEGAWDNGEPGVIFLDRYNQLSTASSIEKIISVNPCGEQGLGAYSVCNLGAMNVAYYVQDGIFDFSSFRRDVKTAVRFLDNVIDKNHYGDMVETIQRQRELRRIGLSVMGLADALIKIKLRYGSPKAVSFTESMFRNMKEAAIEASVALAEEKGAAEGWDAAMLDRPYLSSLPATVRAKIAKHGLRNLFLLTQAPTGTTSILAGVNSGIEPYFSFHYERKDRTGTHVVFAPIYEEFANGGPDKPEFLVTANDLSVEDHIYMQAAAQKHIDSSVSKTLNAPNHHTIEDVEKAYTLAYECGLKSIAYFRDGCGRDQVLTRVEEKKVEQKEPAKREVYARPLTLTGTTTRVQTDIGTAFITVNADQNGNPREVFVNVGKAGTDLSELSEAMGRLISVALQKGVTSTDIRDQLFGVGGYSKFIKSLPSAIALAISEATQKPQELEVVHVEANGNGKAPVAVLAGRTSEACPECKSFSLNHTEGCLTCAVCGYSRC